MTTDAGRDTFDAADVVLVGEVVPPSNAGTDRVWTSTLYAGAGIPWYLIPEPDDAGVTLTLHRLEGSCVEHARSKGDEVLRMADPITAELDPSVLRRSRR